LGSDRKTWISVGDGKIVPLKAVARDHSNQLILFFENRFKHHLKSEVRLPSHQLYTRPNSARTTLEPQHEEPIRFIKGGFIWFGSICANFMQTNEIWGHFGSPIAIFSNPIDPSRPGQSHILWRGCF
jgi:hypothetical protein